MKKEPLILCLTNTVAANFTANCLLAIGAKPAMVEEPSEAAELAQTADALLVNLGTVHPTQAETMRAAIQVANTRRLPWVLDPVGLQLLAYRRKLANAFISLKPSLIRGNHAEIEFILGSVPTLTGSVPILSTGATDKIFDNGEVTEVTGGTPLLQSVTATGCAQGALCAAFLGWGQAPREAAFHASKLMKTAGERAAAKAQTPGTFQLALLDALWEIEHD